MVVSLVLHINQVADQFVSPVVLVPFNGKDEAPIFCRRTQAIDTGNGSDDNCVCAAEEGHGGSVA